MRDWLKGILGGSSPPTPADIPESWVKELRDMLADAYAAGGGHLPGAGGKLDADKLEAAVHFILHGGDAWVRPAPAQTQTGYIQYYDRDQKSPRPEFYGPMADLPAEVLLRWAQVIEAMILLNPYTKLYIPFPGNVHWPELVLLISSGGSLNSWPPPTTQLMHYGVLEKMLAAAQIDASAPIAGAFATPVDSGYGAAQRLSAVANCPDFPAAIARHAKAVSPHLTAGNAAQKVHMLGMLDKARGAPLDALAAEVAELAVSSAKQVRIAADGILQSSTHAIVAPLRELALKGKPEQRLHALRHLYDRGTRTNDESLREWARSTAAADKAPSVQALPNEWESNQAANAASDVRYKIAPVVIDWQQPMTAELTARIDKLLPAMNKVIEANNKRAREHHAQLVAQGNKHNFKLQQNPEIPASVVRKLKDLLADGKAPAGNAEKLTRLLWMLNGVLQEFAVDSPMHITQVFKTLWYFDLLLDNRQSLNHISVSTFNACYAKTNKPSLLELAQMLIESGIPGDQLLRSYCSAYHGLGKNWRPEDVWPYIAQNVPAIENFLLGTSATDYSFDRSMLFLAIASLPVTPPRLVNVLYTVALGTGKSERLMAQEALANLPDKEARIISALSDGKSETRMIAAQWLGRLRHMPAVPALAKAVAAEKHDTAKGAMLDALQILGEPVDKYLKRDSLLAEAKKQLAKGVPKDMEWLPLDSIPEVRWTDNGEQVPPEVLRWMLAQACRAKTPEPNAVLRKYCAMFEPRARAQFGQWVLEHWLREDVAPISPEDALARARSHAQSSWNLMKSHPQYFKDSPLLGKSEAELVAAYLPSLMRTPRGSAAASKGLLAVAAACAAERAAAPVQRYIKEWYGTRASQGKALVAMLAWIEHPSATQVMLAIGNRFRTKSIQEEATRQAEALADRKGWTLAELADRTMPSAGFDESGEMELSYGTRAFTARLLPDFKIELYSPEGKKIAALSEPRQDDDADRAKESKKALSSSKKELKSIVE